MPQLWSYQEEFATGIAKQLASGKKKVVGQLSTGGGKTATMSTISKRYNDKSGKRVLILVHREELLLQTRRTLFDWYEINAQAIDADTKGIYDRSVYVGMCETVFRRMSKNSKYLPDFGLVIIDECHIGNYRKMQALFPNAMIIGFTATPLSSSKKDPLKNYYEDIVVGIGIEELIQIWKDDPEKKKGLVQNHTYSIKGIDRESFGVRAGEFDETQMGNEYSKTRNVMNTLDAYRRHADGTKAIVYNCNVAHSKLVCEAFESAGYPSRHMDSDDSSPAGKKWRRDCFKWLKNTPGAILHNVGIATTGTDEPTVETIIFNRSTLSLTLWIQCAGRGARPCGPDKDKFTIIDLGGNAVCHGDWCDHRDWYSIFHNPPKARDKKSAPPSKECPECESIIAASATSCKFCGHIFPLKPVEYDVMPIELQLVTKNLDVSELIDRNEGSGKKPYFTLFSMGTNLATQAKYKLGKRVMTDTMAEKILELYQDKAKEWIKLKGKKWNDFHKNLTKDHLYEQLKKSFPSWQYSQEKTNISLQV